MCGLCGVLGTEAHWTDAPELRDDPESAEARLVRLRERQQRLALCNRVLAHYGLKLADWQGRALVLRNRTGRSQIVPHVSAVWPAAEALAGRPCDPLDEDTIATFEQ
jgi:hypothetical protein